MTNTHITIGGHKITTNKVGQVHTVTSLASGFTGAIIWCVTNGICVASLWPLTPSAAGANQTVYSDMPKCKTGAVASVLDGGACYIQPNSTVLQIDVNNTNAKYFQIAYPVADDWVES